MVKNKLDAPLNPKVILSARNEDFIFGSVAGAMCFAINSISHMPSSLFLYRDPNSLPRSHSSQTYIIIWDVLM